jgi:hypothetical protein
LFQALSPRWDRPLGFARGFATGRSRRLDQRDTKVGTRREQSRRVFFVPRAKRSCGEIAEVCLDVICGRPLLASAFCSYERFGQHRSYVRPFGAGIMTAGPDEFRLPRSLSLRRALRLVTLAGCPWLSVATVSFITSFVLAKLEPVNCC